MEEEFGIQNKRLQSILQSLTKCKIEVNNDKEELKILRETNTRLELEIKEARELEKSHRYHLQTSREMIGNLQETVSQLVYLKRDVKKLKDEICLKDSTIASMEKEKEMIVVQYTYKINELRAANDKQIDELKNIYEKKVHQVQNESDMQIAQFTCVIEELRSKTKEMEIEHRDKMNVIVLEYEEKIQRGAAQVAQLQDQLARQAARTESNIDAYRRRLEELEEKLKQSHFKQYLAQSPYTNYESQVERPYSVNRDPYPDACPVDTEPVYETNKQKFTAPSQKNQKPNTLQVMYFENKPHVPKGAEKKGQFNITKKRKLYNEKDFQDF